MIVIGLPLEIFVWDYYISCLSFFWRILQRITVVNLSWSPCMHLYSFTIQLIYGSLEAGSPNLLLAPVGCCDDLMKPTKWRSSRPYDHMWNAWRL